MAATPDDTAARRPTSYHRLGLWFTRSRPGVYVLRYVWSPVDRLALRLSGGKRGIAPRAIPELLLTTTGRRSGQPRSNPVLYLRDGDSYVVVGSNYGRRGHPAWTHNLTETPEGSVQIGAEVVPVTARRATSEEFERYWPQLVRIWPGWITYRRMTDREFRMFVLSPQA
ncbi:MAG: nitroreductase family deazaflavin-dependent oxidoreductase [Actinobacteria bacterium]|nr:nitroreductase family deazaflavin-dependent oxidoreductase [Actinomycetota bacterium]